MASSLSCSVEIQISNKTQNITLRNPRTYFGHGCCTKDPLPVLSPGCSGTCSFSNDPQPLGLAGTTGVKGILVYEAESFSLAIYFCNPIDHDQFSTVLGLELSPGRAPLGGLPATYDRMAHGTYSSSEQDIKFTRVTVPKSRRSAQLSHGPIKVRATMVSQTSSRIKVVLEEERRSEEEERRSEEEDRGENAWDVQGDRSRRSEETSSRETVQALSLDIK